MQQDISGMNDTPHRPDEVPKEQIEELLNEGSASIRNAQADDQAGIEQLSPLEAAELLESIAPAQGEDSVLMVETAILPEAAEGVFPEQMPVGTTGLDIALPWYRARWFYISAGVVATVLTSAGTILLIQGLRKRKHQGFLGGQMKTVLQQASLPALRVASSRTQGRLGQLTNQLGSQSSKRIGQLQKQFSQIIGQTQQARGRVKAMQQVSAIAPSRTRGLLANFSKGASTRLGILNERARATTARTTSQVQQSLASMGTGVSTGVSKTGASLRRGWKRGRMFLIGIGSGAVWASLFTPEKGEDTRAHLAATLQRIGKKSQ
jgi:hypothetical protein